MFVTVWYKVQDKESPTLARRISLDSLKGKGVFVPREDRSRVYQTSFQTGGVRKGAKEAFGKRETLTSSSNLYRSNRLSPLSPEHWNGEVPQN